MNSSSRIIRSLYLGGYDSMHRIMSFGLTAMLLMTTRNCSFKLLITGILLDCSIALNESIDSFLQDRK